MRVRASALTGIARSWSPPAAMPGRVRDHGPDPRAQHDRLFLKFQHGAPPVGGAPGIGMGLFIVATLAARMRATVRYEPGEQGGVRFILTPPAPA